MSSRMMRSASCIVSQYRRHHHHCAPLSAPAPPLALASAVPAVAEEDLLSTLAKRCPSAAIAEGAEPLLSDTAPFFCAFTAIDPPGTSKAAFACPTAAARPAKANAAALKFNGPISPKAAASAYIFKNQTRNKAVCDSNTNSKCVFISCFSSCSGCARRKALPDNSRCTR